MGISTDVVSRSVVSSDIIYEQGGGSASSQFITKELFTSSKDITRGFANYPVAFQTGMTIPLGAINDNIAPLSYGNQEIFGLYHMEGVGTNAGSNRTQLVVAYDGTNADAGFVSVTINGVTYIRASTTTGVILGTALVDGTSRPAVFFTFQNVLAAASGFDEPDDTQLPITWVI